MRFLVIGIVVILAVFVWVNFQEVKQVTEEVVLGKRFTVDGSEIVDSCVTQTYGQFRMQGLAMQGYSAGIDRMDNPCDSIHAYYLVRK